MWKIKKEVEKFFSQTHQFEFVGMELAKFNTSYLPIILDLILAQRNTICIV